MGALLFYLLKVLFWGLILGFVALLGMLGWNVFQRFELPSSRQAAEGPELDRRMKFWGGLALVALAAALIVNVFGKAFVKIPAGHRGVIFSTTKGVSPRILPEGIHAIAPILESVKTFDVRKHNSDFDGQAATKDQQTVHTKITLWYAPDPGAVNVIYQKVGESYAEKLIPGHVSETMKAEVARYNALGLLSDRERVAGQIRDSLKAKLAIDNLLVYDVAIGNFQFSEEFNKAIEEKQTAEQTALKKTYELQAALKQAQIVKTQAEGEAQAEIAKA